MDAFEKLAKLAGASVESVGEGLPRTWSEAKALGAARYFTGRPCSRGHVAERLASTGNCTECRLMHARLNDAKRGRKEYMRQYSATPKRKEYLRQYGATPECKERNRQRYATPEYKEYMRQYSATPEAVERMRHRKLTKTGDSVLFAVNQAEQAARKARAPADIIPQCPEPQRSQLQALVDRIKADPQAGKAVVGLLRTMRELRKAELAEMQAGVDEG